MHTAVDGNDALLRVDELAPDVIVLDVLMPGTDGLAVCRILRDRGNRTPVLMLTARHEVSDRVAGLDAGADDYLVKPFALDELLARLRALLRRASVTGGERRPRASATLTLDPQRRQAWRGDRELTLTKTEFDLLELLMFNAGVVVTRETIYERIWGFDFETSSKSLDVYIGYLRRKTEADGERAHHSHGSRRRLHRPHRMSLRLRLALVVAITFAIVVIGCVFAAHVSASHELRAEIDRFLQQRGADAAASTTGPSSVPIPASGSTTTRTRSPIEPDAVVQFARSQGDVVAPGHGPACRSTRATARSRRRSARESRSSCAPSRSTARPTACSRCRHRQRRRADRPRASPSTEQRAVDARHPPPAHRARRYRWSPPLLAWFIARRIVRPVERLTAATEHVATTQDLESTIAVDRRDELGRLAASFNTMLVALRGSRDQQKRLVMDASHELRTPLTALRTNIEVLQRIVGPDDAERAELLGVGRRRAARAHRVGDRARRPRDRCARAKSRRRRSTSASSPTASSIASAAATNERSG